MPGPISDSYDPEFGTGGNASRVRNASQEVINLITEAIKPSLLYIVDVCDSENGPPIPLNLSERQWRIIRFHLRRSLESV